MKEPWQAPFPDIESSSWQASAPVPFAAMMLADMGAEVVRVERAASVRGPAPATPHFDVLLRGRRNIAIDLKHPDGVATLLDLVASADGLIEGFRPKVMERLGIGPDVCLERNPKLVFGRMTGWGQTGPLADAAGHDINYISLAGALAHFGRAGEAPVPPLNMVGDFGGGGMFLAFGVVCALLEAQRSGQGQVVDAAMVDGSAVLMSMFWAFKSIGLFDENQRGTNLLDTGAHFYDVYRCADGEYISIGSIEPQFYAELLRLDRSRRRRGVRRADGQVGVAAPEGRGSPRCSRRSHATSGAQLMEATDVCFAPVLTMSEAAAASAQRRAQARSSTSPGTMQPAPAPRFSRTPAEIAMPAGTSWPALGRDPARLGLRRRQN